MFAGIGGHYGGHQPSVISHQSSLHQVGEFFAGLEAGTGFGGGAGHLAVAADEGLGELAMEVAEESDEGSSLLEGAGVLRFAFGIETAFIADADGAAVEGSAMGSYLVEAAVLRHGAITADIEVITHVDESTPQMVAPELLRGVVLVLTGGGAVDDEKSD